MENGILSDELEFIDVLSYNPLRTNEFVAGAAKFATRKTTSESEKLRDIYRYINKFTLCDIDDRSRSPREPAQTLEDRAGNYTEKTILFMLLARTLGFESGYTRVTQDCEGEDVEHVCAWVDLDGIKYFDFSYSDGEYINHQSGERLSDIMAKLHCYESFKQNYAKPIVEEKGEETLLSEADELMKKDKLCWENNYKKAIQLYDCVLAVNPKNAEALQAKAWMFYKLKDYRNALYFSKRAVFANGNDKNYLSWALLARSIGKVCDSVYDLKDAILFMDQANRLKWELNHPEKENYYDFQFKKSRDWISKKLEIKLRKNLRKQIWIPLNA